MRAARRGPPRDAWLTRACERVCTLPLCAPRSFARHAASLPSSLDGKILTRMPAAHFSFRLCGGDKRAGDAVFRALKAEIERVNELKAAYQEQMRDQRHARGRA